METRLTRFDWEGASMVSTRFFVIGVMLAVCGTLGGTVARAAEGDVLETAIVACNHGGDPAFATHVAGIQLAGPIPDRLIAALEAESSCARMFSRLARAGFVLIHRLQGVQGDFDGDGDVDGRDFLVWQRGNAPLPGASMATVLLKCEYVAGDGLKTRVVGREIGGAISTTLRAALADLETCAQADGVLAGAGFEFVSGGPAPTANQVDGSDFLVWQRNMGSGL
jgi:hypothetical protein